MSLDLTRLVKNLLKACFSISLGIILIFQPFGLTIDAASKQPSMSGDFVKDTVLVAQSLKETIVNLSEKGLSRIALLGGAKLVGSFLREDLINELQLTLTPKLLGGPYTWVPHNVDNLPLKLASLNAWQIKKIERIEDNELILQYTRNE